MVTAVARSTFVVLLVLLTACAASTRPPVRSTATAHDAGAEAEAESETADDDVADADGDAEATSDLAAAAGPCPSNMVLVASGEAQFCVDKYEASLVESDADGNEKPFPHWLPVDGHTVRAVSEPAVFPQGFISEVQAEDACAASGKRLCSVTEWKTACMGPQKTTFPYGDARKPGTCNDTGKSAVAAVFGLKALADPVAIAPPSPRGVSSPGASSKHAMSDRHGIATSPSGPKGAKPTKPTKPTKPVRTAHAAVKGRAAETTRPRATRPGPASAKADRPAKKKETTRSAKRAPAKASTRPASVEPSVWTQLNDPRLGQVDGALARTGSHEACVNGYGAVDMVGNLHEWVKTDAAAAHGTFAGGYYLDTTLNGDGCQYRTTAHAHDYHDYSTGFRCCADPKAAVTTP